MCTCVLQAKNMLEGVCPGLLAERRDVSFTVELQTFVELLRGADSAVAEQAKALQYARSTLPQMDLDEAQTERLKVSLRAPLSCFHTKRRFNFGLGLPERLKARAGTQARARATLWHACCGGGGQLHGRTRLPERRECSLRCGAAVPRKQHLLSCWGHGSCNSRRQLAPYNYLRLQLRLLRSVQESPSQCARLAPPLHAQTAEQ